MSSSILSVRVTDSERNLIEAAAANSHTKLSDFVRRKTLEAAELEMIERRVIEIPEEQWHQIESLLVAPAKSIPAVKQLQKFQPIWKA